MSKMKADEVTQYELDTRSRCADGYLITFAGLTSQAIPFLFESVGNSHGRHVLDLGSGPGNVAELFAAGGAEVTGADFSPADGENRPKSLFSYFVQGGKWRATPL